MVLAWHANVAHHELREEGEVKADEDGEGAQLAKRFGVHASTDLRPPEVKTRKVGQHHSAHHDVVEVCDHEVGIMQVNVSTERREEQTGQAANQEQADKAQGVKHGGFKGNGPFVQGSSPVEH